MYFHMMFYKILLATFCVVSELSVCEQRNNLFRPLLVRVKYKEQGTRTPISVTGKLLVSKLPHHHTHCVQASSNKWRPAEQELGPPSNKWIR